MNNGSGVCRCLPGVGMLSSVLSEVSMNVPRTAALAHAYRVPSAVCLLAPSQGWAQSQRSLLCPGRPCRGEQEPPCARPFLTWVISNSRSVGASLSWK